MRIEFDDTQYQFSHGRAPRGYGSWAFAFDRGCDQYFFLPAMNYADAKRKAKEMVKAARGSSVRVFDSRRGTHVDYAIGADSTGGTLYVCS